MTTQRKYIVLPLGLYQQLPSDKVTKLNWLISVNGGEFIELSDISAVLVNDASMSESVCDEIMELLDGYEYHIKEFPTLPAPTGLWKPWSMRRRSTYTELGRQPSVRSMRRKP